MDSKYPWYDSLWLSDFVRAKHLIARQCPEKYLEFLAAFEPLRTRPDFEIARCGAVLDEQTVQIARKLIRTLKDHERHEISSFGRLVVHNHPFFNELQQSLTQLVSNRVNEPVEPNYNFLCLYSELGRCEVHMDSPEAKWTLDCCLDQSAPWPIYFSQVQPWPEAFQLSENWNERILSDPQNVFTECTLRPGEGVIFSGSSQWHFRDQIPTTTTQEFCHLIFFHFVPKGMKLYTDVRNWPDLFDIPQLRSLELSNV